MSTESALVGPKVIVRPLELPARHGAVRLTPDQVRAALQRACAASGVYDQVESDPQRIALLDLAIPTLLGAHVDFEALATVEPREGVAGLQGRLRDASVVLRELPSEVDLWDWRDTTDHVRLLSRLYAACSLPEFGPSQITKLLHRKRPRLLPIVDESCIWPSFSIADPTAWTVDELVRITFAIRAALSRQGDALLDLRRLADEMGPPLAKLSTLRLYDLLAWTHAEGAGP